MLVFFFLRVNEKILNPICLVSSYGSGCHVIRIYESSEKCDIIAAVMLMRVIIFFMNYSQFDEVNGYVPVPSIFKKVLHFRHSGTNFKRTDNKDSEEVPRYNNTGCFFTVYLYFISLSVLLHWIFLTI